MLTQPAFLSKSQRVRVQEFVHAFGALESQLESLDRLVGRLARATERIADHSSIYQSAFVRMGPCSVQVTS